jgi:hypothetical protein
MSFDNANEATLAEAAPLKAKSDAVWACHRLVVTLT